MPACHYNAAQIVLPVTDIPVACEWYEALGFRTTWVNRDADDPAGNFAVLCRDTARVMLILDAGGAHDHPWEMAGNGYLFLLVTGVHEVFQIARDHGLPIDTGLVPQPWGPPGFQLTDPSGNRVCVAEDVSAG